MMKLQKIQNSVINNIFVAVTVETEAKREESQLVFDTYPYVSELCDLCNVNETFSKSISDYTDNQKLRLKTIVAHMCEIGKAIAKNYESIDVGYQTIYHFKTSKEIDEESKRQFCSLQERSIALYKSANEPLHMTMSILIALLIKDTYCMDQETRLLIISFFVKADIILALDKVSLLNTGLGFSFIFKDNKRFSTSGLSGTLIAANLDEGCDKNGIMIPIFAFNSDELKANNLPAELEADWPFSV